MGRNLDRRVEILFPVLDPRLIRQVKTEVLDTCLEDTAKARIMQPDGTYRRAEAVPGRRRLDSQAELIRRRHGAQAARSVRWRSTFFGMVMRARRKAGRAATPSAL